MSGLGLRLLVQPSLEYAAGMVVQGIAARRNMILVGKVSVHYRGRASSSLEPGDRLVLIKSDGSTLIHRPRDYSPVNWQPAGPLFKTEVQDGLLVIRVTRPKDREALRILVHDILLLAFVEMHDVAEFHLHATEEEMRDAILKAPSLVEEGFRPLKPEQPVASGFVDVVGQDRDGNLTVVEVKKSRAGKTAVIQLKRYVDELRKTETGIVRGILAAPSMSKGVQSYLAGLSLEYRLLSPKQCAEVLRLRGGKGIAEYLSQGFQ